MIHAYEIVAARPEHVGMLGARLRALDMAEAEATGLSPYRALGRGIRNSVIARTAFVDGEIAAMWGLGAGLLASEGTPWLMTSEMVEKMPLAFLKQSRKEVRQMLEITPSLSNFVLASYTRAVRLVAMLGFAVDEAQPFGPKGVMFRRFHMEA